MPSPPLACTVRDCGLLIEPHGRTWSCARRHSYDVARSGYLNLLQPTDRRSRHAGDSREAVQARQRLLALGGGRALADAIVERAAHLAPADAVVVDLGCGSGELLMTLAARLSCLGIGIDLSSAAIEIAARQAPSLTWVVANADRRLPVLDATVDVVLSLHGRRNPVECRRVLTRGGHLLVAVPAPDDLIEVRRSVYGEGVERERGEAIVAEHAEAFTPVDRAVIRERHRLSPDALRDLLRGTYRGARRSAAARLTALEPLDVSFASELFVFTGK